MEREGRSAKCIVHQEKTAVSMAPEARKPTRGQCPFEFVGVFGLQPRFGVVLDLAHVPNARRTRCRLNVGPQVLTAFESHIATEWVGRGRGASASRGDWKCHSGRNQISFVIGYVP